MQIANKCFLYCGCARLELFQRGAEQNSLFDCTKTSDEEGYVNQKKFMLPMELMKELVADYA
jgi:hypothetical protein